MSGFRMVDRDSVFEWSGFRMFQKQDGYQTISLDHFIYNKKIVLNIKWSRLMIRQPSCFWTIRKPDFSVQFSNGFGQNGGQNVRFSNAFILEKCLVFE